VIVRLFLDETGETLAEAIVGIDKGTVSRPTFRDIGLAVQAGSYEALRSVWPHERKVS
jgi:hypothetical protein